MEDSLLPEGRIGFEENPLKAISGMVSIVIAVKNSGATVQQCLDSIDAQTYRDRELVIIDGGSTDGTVEIIQRNAGLLSHWESASDRGIYHAWNKALRHVRGEWITFLGADDRYLETNALANLMERAGPDVDLVSGRCTWVDEEGIVRKIWGYPWSWKLMRKKNCICHPGSLIHKRLFDRYGKFDEQFSIAADYEFNLRPGPSLHAEFIDKPLIAFGISGVSMQNRQKALFQMFRIQAKHPLIGPFRALINLPLPLMKHGIVRIARTFGIPLY